MNTRYIAEEYRLSHWKGIMRERAESGQSIKAYCKTAGFHENVYYYWQRKLQEAACQELISATNRTDIQASIQGGLVGVSESSAPIPSGWAECEERNREGKEGAISIEIGKSRVLAKTDVDLEHLEKVCRVLTSLC